MVSSPDRPSALESRLAALADRGVTLVDPRQTYLGPEVELSRIEAGAVLHPGTRVLGRRSFIGAGAEIGSQGPAVLRDSAVARGAEVASGYLEGAVLLAGARVGANAHVRPGTLLEEQASTAHCVGLKQSILLAFVTLGSLINFCDCLMAGGSSREDHSEVGSGFIHFNFTPWGERGDKATPSLVGDVVRGVFLREHRIFLGGLGGLVGPTSVGYGSVVAAGQVVRRDVDEHSFVLRNVRPIERAVSPGWRDRLQPRLRRNIRYVAQLFALRAWYRDVRLARLSADDPRRPPVVAGLEAIESGIAERSKQLRRFVVERGGRVPSFSFAADELPRCPWQFEAGADATEHLEWLRDLSDDEVDRGRAWLSELAELVERCAEAETRGES